LKALQSKITTTAGKSRTGAVALHEFKRKHLETFVPKQVLPDPLTLMNCHLWDHLRGKVPDQYLDAIDEAVELAVEKLDHDGIAQRGGTIGDQDFPRDYLLLMQTGVKRVLAGEVRVVRSTEDLDAFNDRDFHPALVAASRELFADGHYSQAIFEGCKRLAEEVRKKSGLATDGFALMATAFSANTPLLKLNNMSTQTERDEQQGYMHLAMGAMQAVRNPGAHAAAAAIDRKEALEVLSMISLLLRKVDAATV
jgi:uncharacterized protein (TIGR02391 family)